MDATAPSSLPSRFGDEAGRKLSGFLLVAANALPVVGVLFWGWNLFEIVALYWFENVVVGVLNVVRMIACNPDAKHLREFGGGRFAHQFSKFLLVPFFCVHYGMFTMGHGIFVVLLLGPKNEGSWMGNFSGNPFEILPELFRELAGTSSKWAALALVGSHLASFVVHFVVRGEYRRLTTSVLMFAPYARIVVLHLAILGGAFAIAALGSPLALLLILVAGKTAIDLALHRRSHRAASSS